MTRYKPIIVKAAYNLKSSIGNSSIPSVFALVESDLQEGVNLCEKCALRKFHLTSLCNLVSCEDTDTFGINGYLASRLFIPLGGVFYFGKAKIRCDTVSPHHTLCYGCVFNDHHQLCGCVQCMSKDRDDGRDAHFVLLEGELIIEQS